MVRAGLYETGRCRRSSITSILPLPDLELVALVELEDAQTLASEHAIDLLVIVDRCGGSAASDACRVIRSSPSSGWIPLIVLLDGGHDARGRVESLEAGADEAIPTDLGTREMAARTRAVLRRCLPEWECEQRYSDGILEVDARSGRARSAASRGAVQLTPVELATLWMILRESPSLVSLQRLSAAAGLDPNDAGGVRAVIRSLQRKLGPGILQVRRGWGYRYVRPPEE